MREGALEGAPAEETVAFWKKAALLHRGVSAAQQAIGQARTRIEQLREAAGRSQSAPDGIDREIYEIEQALHEVEKGLSGSGAKNEVGEPTEATVADRLGAVLIGTRFSTYGPTPTHRKSLQWGQESFSELRSQLNRVLTERIPAVEDRLADAGAPWTPGAPIPPIE